MLQIQHNESHNTELKNHDRKARNTKHTKIKMIPINSVGKNREVLKINSISPEMKLDF